MTSSMHIKLINHKTNDIVEKLYSRKHRLETHRRTIPLPFAEILITYA